MTTLRVGTEYGACRWASEQQAKLAWEAACKDIMGCSVWRTAAPSKPPHRDHIVIVMGEDEAIVKRRVEVLRSFGGDEWPMDPELVKALQARRLRAAFDRGNTSFQQRGLKARMDRTGRLWRD